MHGSNTLRYNAAMGIEERGQVDAPALQYATPKGLPRGWMACIVGLFVWGTLVLLLIPVFIWMVVYDSVTRWAPPRPLELCFLCGVIGFLLLMGLPPILTARGMIRREVRHYMLTNYVMALPTTIGLSGSLGLLGIGMFGIPYGAWRAVAAGAIGTVISIYALWSVLKLGYHARQLAANVGPDRHSEATYAKS